MRKTLSTPTKYSKLYDELYGNFAAQKKYEISDKYKSTLIAEIFSDIPINEQVAIHVLSKPKYTYDQAAKIAKMDKKVLLKSHELALKHLMSPKNIAIAVNGYYDVPTMTPITDVDFGFRKYIVTALNNQGILYREQLFKHIDNGWYYLWTIPGCGDTARQSILKALDKWGYKHNTKTPRRSTDKKA